MTGEQISVKGMTGEQAQKLLGEKGFDVTNVQPDKTGGDLTQKLVSVQAYRESVKTEPLQAFQKEEGLIFVIKTEKKQTQNAGSGTKKNQETVDVTPSAPTPSQPAPQTPSGPPASDVKIE